MVVIHPAMSCVREGAPRIRCSSLSSWDFAVCSWLIERCYFRSVLPMSDVPEQPQSQSFFDGSPSDGCIVYMVAKEV